MPQDERIGVSTASKGRHPRVYIFLCQLIIAIVTFYCTIAISSNGLECDPAPASAAPRAVAPRTPLSDANSTTTSASKYIEDLSTLLIATIPSSVLCPSTPFFFLSVISFLLGIFTFNSLHTEDLGLAYAYSLFIIANLFSLDWQNVLVSFQGTMPMAIWLATVFLPIAHWLFKTFSPDLYGRYRQAKRLQAEEFREIMEGRGERVGDVEAAGEAVEERDVEEGIDKEIPLMRDEGRTRLVS